MNDLILPIGSASWSRSLWHSDAGFRQALRQQRRAWQAAHPLPHLALEQSRPQRRAYLQGLFFFYDPCCTDRDGRYRIDDFLDDGERSFGGYDEIILWQPYPRHGIDGRDQFAIWRDMPGGVAALHQLVACCHRRGVRCLLNYIPWDSALPIAEHPAEMAGLIADTGADGVYGDTTFGMPAPMAEAVRQVRPEALLDCEHCPRSAADLANQTASWWQDGPRRDPSQIMTLRWYEPRLMVRSVSRQLRDRGALIRDALVAGCGLVLWENIFGWWNPFHAGDRQLVRRAASVLRAYDDCFQDPAWEPLDAPLAPAVLGNRFRGDDRELIAVRNADPATRTIAAPWSNWSGDERVFDAWSGAELVPGRPVAVAGDECAHAAVFNEQMWVAELTDAGLHLRFRFRDGQGAALVVP